MIQMAKPENHGLVFSSCVSLNQGPSSGIVKRPTGHNTPRERQADLLKGWARERRMCLPVFDPTWEIILRMQPQFVAGGIGP